MHPCRADPRRAQRAAIRGQVDAGRQPAAAAQAGQPVAPRRAPRRRSSGPSRRRRASRPRSAPSDHDRGRGRRAGGRGATRSARTGSASHGVADERGSRAPRPPGGRRRGRAGRRRRASSASRPVATRSSSAVGRSAGSTGRGPKRVVAAAPTSSRSGRPRPGGAGLSTRSTSPAAGRPARLSRRSSSSCWAPGRHGPPAASAPAPRQSLPGRRAAGAQVGDPAPGAALAACAHPDGSLAVTARAAGRRPGGPGWSAAGRGRAGGPPRGSSPRARRARPRSSRLAGTLSGLRHRSSSAGGTGRRSSRSPTTSTPLPSSHSIQRSACSSAQSNRPRRQPDRRRLAVDQLALGEHLADQRVVARLAAGRAVEPAVELADQLGLGDAERPVGAVAVVRRPRGVDAERLAEAQPQQVAAPAGRRSAGR